MPTAETAELFVLCDHQKGTVMKVLLRQPVTGLFYAGSDQWTGNAAEALDFEATDRAMDQAWASNLGEVEVLLHFDNPSFQIPMAIHGFGR